MEQNKKGLFSEFKNFIYDLNKEILNGELEDENLRQLHEGISFIYINNLLNLLANEKDFQISEENHNYQHFRIELNNVLHRWKENWKTKGLDVDIAINSIKRI